MPLHITKNCSPLWLYYGQAFEDATTHVFTSRSGFKDVGDIGRYKKWCVGILYLFYLMGYIISIIGVDKMEIVSQQWLFKATIDGNESWAKVFQSISDFKPLIYSIFIKHNLRIGKIENLTPGTNAVFRIDDKVIKIFAPVESGFSTGYDYNVELVALRHANNVKVTAPLLVCSGFIEDKYLFRYIVMDFISGCESEEKSLHFNNQQKIDFAYKLKAMTQKLNVKLVDKEIPILGLNECLENMRWNEFPESFQLDRKAFIKRNSPFDYVYTHGDLTGENTIIGDDSEIYIIDFADSRLAPYYYEWSPIIFALFGCDPIMMGIFFGDYQNDDFYDKLTLSMVIHEFGSIIIKQICEISDISINSIADVFHLKELLIKSISSGRMKVR